ncbi:MAG: ester cyclase, partial [Actinomycetota bacterium]
MPNPLVQRYFGELLSAPDNLAVADEIFTEDVEFVNPVSANRIKGIDEYKAFAHTWYVGFPDRKFTVEEEIEEGDKVAARFKITATHN